MIACECVYAHAEKEENSIEARSYHPQHTTALTLHYWIRVSTSAVCYSLTCGCYSTWFPTSVGCSPNPQTQCHCHLTSTAAASVGVSGRQQNITQYHRASSYTSCMHVVEDNWARAGICMYVKIDTYRKRCYSVTNEESTGEYIDLDEHIRTYRNQSITRWLQNVQLSQGSNEPTQYLCTCMCRYAWISPKATKAATQQFRVQHMYGYLTWHATRTLYLSYWDVTEWVRGKYFFMACLQIAHNSDRAGDTAELLSPALLKGELLPLYKVRAEAVDRSYKSCIHVHVCMHVRV